MQEATGPVPILDDDGVLRVLRESRRIAIVGASPDAVRPSHGVMRYLLEQGYDCVPVNPMTQDVQGRRAFPSLEAAVAETGTIDLVDVFRRPEYVPDVARRAIAVAARALWLQLGVVSWEGARIAHEGGLEVVMDRCTAIEHRRLLAGR